MVTQRRKVRTGRELRFDAARRNRTDRESHTSAALLESYSCVAAQYFTNVTKNSITAYQAQGVGHCKALETHDQSKSEQRKLVKSRLFGRSREDCRQPSLGPVTRDLESKLKLRSNMNRPCEI